MPTQVELVPGAPPEAQQRVVGTETSHKEQTNTNWDACKTVNNNLGETRIMKEKEQRQKTKITVEILCFSTVDPLERTKKFIQENWGNVDAYIGTERESSKRKRRGNNSKGRRLRRNRR